ncbi:MAG TPA: hypothetical protein VLB02_01390 [Candidatus Paceibacterota bacterium]|nr:hypothetical protein [Candidatus Paceibacterota bacterium]
MPRPNIYQNWKLPNHEANKTNSWETLEKKEAATNRKKKIPESEELERTMEAEREENLEMFSDPD